MRIPTAVNLIAQFLIFSFGFGFRADGFQDFDPSPADGITQLINYPYSKNEIVNDQKIPIILIHGLHSAVEFNKDGLLDEHEAAEQSEGWDSFIENFQNDQTLKESYRIYRFVYLSDIQNDWEIARSLRNKIDNAITKRFINDSEFILIAHSMGGLIARSYMQQHSHLFGKYKNQRGGERARLTTLGTPHHGSPITNHDSRSDLARNSDERDSDYHRHWNMTDPLNKWTNLLSAGSFFFWTKWWERIEYTEPNRKDLLWDNFDQVMNEKNPDMNLWLKGLNQDTTYDSKITAYYGSIDTSSDEYRKIVDQIYTLSPFAGPSILIGQILKTEDEHKKLLCGGIALNYGLYKNKNLYESNDGVVPSSSAAFENHQVAKRIACKGCDHLDLNESLNKVCENGLGIFDSIKADLIGSSVPSPPKVVGEWFNAPISAVAVNGNFSFIGYNNYPYSAYGISTLDISDPNRISLIKNFGATDYSRIRSLTTNNNFLFATGPEEGFSIYNISNPRNPRLTGSLRSGYWAGSKAVALKGNFAFVAVSSNIEILDVADPKNIKRVYTYGFPGGYGCGDICIRGNLLFATDNQSQIAIANISNPRSVRTIKVFFPNGLISDIFADNNYLYSANCSTTRDNSDNGLEIFKISSPSNPTLVQEIKGFCGNKIVTNNQVVGFGHKNGFKLFRTQDSGIRELFSLDYIGQAYDIKIENNRLFVAHSNGLSILEF